MSRADDNGAPETPQQMWRRIRRLEITARRLVAEQFAGSYHSVFKGAGLQFEQIREYAPGDDPRLIDHNATARLGKPFVKLFVEERQLQVMLLVDMSASLRFGTVGRLKRQLAAEFVAAISFAALANNDKVGLALCAETVERVLPPHRGRRHILTLLHELLNFEPSTPGTRLEVGLEKVGRQMRRRGVIFVVSDFLGGLNEATVRQMRWIGRRHDLIAVSVLDPAESHPERLPAHGLWRFEEPESGRQRVVDLAWPPARRALIARTHRWRDELAESLRRAEVERIALSTEGSLVPALLGFFNRRTRHMRQGV